MNAITFQYPAWYLLLCAALGLLFALGLYYKDKTFREQSATLNWLLGGVRFLAVMLASIFLLSPLLRTLETETRPPIIVFAQDVSESVGAYLDETGTKAEYLAQLGELEDALGRDYDLQVFSFGEEMRESIDTSFGDKVSNLSELMRNIDELYNGANLGAVILATDGIYNEGSNPVYLPARTTAPVFAVALGDTVPQKDVGIRRTYYNRIAYLGDRFSVQVDLGARNAAGSEVTLTAYKIENGRALPLERREILIDRDDFFSTAEVVLDADQSGVQRYRIGVSAVSGEVNLVNNSKDIFIDVLDARQQILLLAAAPHPDLTAIRQSISTNKNYELEVAYLDDLPQDLQAFDFVILHQVPSAQRGGSRIIDQLDEYETPRLYILGAESDYRQVNQRQSLMGIATDGRNTNDVQGRLAPDFNFFTVEEALNQSLSNYPPLLAPFGEFVSGGGGQTLLYQRIRKIDTNYPLLVLGEEGGVKTGVLAAEGIWKWRLFNFLQEENHDEFDGLMSKIVQFLSLKEDKRRFRVSVSKNLFDENEQVFLDAELYNNSYELINDPDAGVVITDEAGKEYSYTFNKTERAYSLNAGTLPVGSYRFRAAVTSNGNLLEYFGQFSVQPIQLELFSTTADHGLLQLLANRYGGAVVDPAGMNTVLPGRIKAEGTIKPVIYQTTRTKSLINLRWLFFILIALLTLEWFLRRYFGAY